MSANALPISGVYHCRRKEAFQRLRKTSSLTRKSIIEVWLCAPLC